jgi:hypothetical protein
VCLQKMTIGGLLVFFEPSVAQTVLGFLFAVSWGVLFSAVRPFTSHLLNGINDTCSISIIVALLGALSLRATENAQDLMGVSKSVVNGLLIFSTAFPVAILFIVLIVTAAEKALERRERHQEALQQAPAEVPKPSEPARVYRSKTNRAPPSPSPSPSGPPGGSGGGNWALNNVDTSSLDADVLGFVDALRLGADEAGALWALLAVNQIDTMETVELLSDADWAEVGVELGLRLRIRSHLESHVAAAVAEASSRREPKPTPVDASPSSALDFRLFDAASAGGTRPHPPPRQSQPGGERRGGRQALWHLQEL